MTRLKVVPVPFRGFPVLVRAIAHRLARPGRVWSLHADRLLAAGSVIIIFGAIGRRRARDPIVPEGSRAVA